MYFDFSCSMWADYFRLVNRLCIVNWFENHDNLTDCKSQLLWRKEKETTYLVVEIICVLLLIFFNLADLRYCGKTVTLKNFRKRFMSVKPKSRWFPEVGLEQSAADKAQGILLIYWITERDQQWSKLQQL